MLLWIYFRKYIHPGILAFFRKNRLLNNFDVANCFKALITQYIVPGFITVGMFKSWRLAKIITAHAFASPRPKVANDQGESDSKNPTFCQRRASLPRTKTRSVTKENSMILKTDSKKKSRDRNRGRNMFIILLNNNSKKVTTTNS